MKHIAFALLGTCWLLTACSDTKKIAPKEGRIAVMEEEKVAQSQEKINLDKASILTEWNTSDANIRNKKPALSLKKGTLDWKAKGAKGRSKNDLPMVSPVIIKDKIYVLDHEGRLFARNVKDGSELWRADLKTKAQGVGLAANTKVIITIDENGTVGAFDVKGKELWKKEFKTPFRTAPLLTDKALYLLSFNNDLWVLDPQKGQEKWRYKTSAPLTLLQGMGRPAVANNVVVVPFSTGEIIAFDATTGALLWSQDLIGTKVFDAVAQISQMTASPVIENGIVYLLGHGGKMMAVNLKTGESLWQLARGGRTTPLISGNALFFVDNNNHLVALNKKSGKLFWEVKLDKVVWKGPYLVDEKLVLLSDEKGILVNPKDGKITPVEKRIAGSMPAFTNEGVFFVGNNGVLYHWGKI